MTCARVDRCAPVRITRVTGGMPGRALVKRLCRGDCAFSRVIATVQVALQQCRSSALKMPGLPDSRPEAPVRRKLSKPGREQMRIECHYSLDDAAAAEWRAALAAARHHHVRQDPKFAELERAKGISPIFALGRRPDGTIAALAWFLREPHPLLPGRFVRARAPSGPVCDDAGEMTEFLAGLVRHPALATVHSLVVTPYWLGEEAEDLARRLVDLGGYSSDPDNFRSTGLIDLTRSGDEILKGFSKSSRYSVRQVEKSPIIIRRLDNLAEAAIFFDLLNRRFLSRVGAPPFPPAEYPLTIERRPGDFAESAIFAAFLGDALLGGLLVNRGGRFAHAHRYVADPEAAARVAGDLRVAPSIWLAGMLWAKAEGCTVFDVEGFQRIIDLTHPKYKIYEYKRQLGPTENNRLRQHTLPSRPVLHRIDRMPSRLHQAVRQHLPAVAAWLKRQKG